MIRAAALALLASPAAAQVYCGFGFPPAVQTSVEIALSDNPDIWAVVTIRNRLAGRSGHPDRPCRLVIDHEEVLVFYDPGPRAVPDRFRVVVPPGYVADPAEMILPDDQDATVPIRRAITGPTG
jgi:hypothetical protein